VKKAKEARRYAKVLLNTAGIENAPQMIAEVSVVNDLMIKGKDFRGMLVSPEFTSEEREKFMGQIAGRIGLSQSTVKFIMHLSELKVIGFLSEILRIAEALYLEKKRRVKAMVMTPIEIGKDYHSRLMSSLQRLMQRDVDIEYKIEPSLLGGVLIKVGSTLYDTSIKGQLRLLKEELIR